MREIKYRAKATATGKWVYGAYCTATPNIIFADGKTIDIDPETAGQFTGMQDQIIPKRVAKFTGSDDRPHNDIYEGDIITATPLYGGTERKGVVVWNGNLNGWAYKIMGKHCPPFPLGERATRTYFIIGNIYDTPKEIQDRWAETNNR